MATANGSAYRHPFFVSAVLHALFFALLWSLPATRKQLMDLMPNPRHVTWIQVSPADDPSNRLVQTELTKKSDQARKDAFLGQQNQVVDRETVSQKRIQDAARSQKAQQPAAHAAAPAKSRTEKSAAHPFDKLGVALSPPPTAKEALQQAQMERLAAQDSSLAPSGPSDYVKGLKESERTALNTQEFVFFGYFQRIRQRLDFSWNKSLKDQLGKFYKKGRSLASEVDHITKLVVTLNDQGLVTRVQVVEESGTEDLDTAAIEAFNSAGPFPNPPRGLLNAAGEIRIRWDFVLRT